MQIRSLSLLLALACCPLPAPAQSEPPAEEGSPELRLPPEVDRRELARAYLKLQEQEPAPAPVPEPPTRRAPPQPLDDVFPLTEYIGPTIGVPDTTPVYPLNRALWDALPELEEANIRVYGWVNPSISRGTSRESNFPLSYNVAANTALLNQMVLRIERPVDTVQTDHVDVGFRLTNLYGSDYRFTTAQGMFSNQLLGSNNLYGYDPVEAYAQIYVPQVADGLVLTVGRYISPADIEAQTSPANFLFTHSLMFTVDPYTFTGVRAELKLDDQWQIMAQLHAGNDVMPWDPAARLNGGLMARWVSTDNNDSIWAGVNSVNGASFNNGHDQLNHFVGTWSHKINDEINTMTEVYYEFNRNGLVGGTVNNGPPQRYFRNVGAGALVPGIGGALGIVNYTNFKLSDRDYLTFRTDYLNDPDGIRTGYTTSFGSLTLGWTHRFSPLFTVRPELRYERAFGAGITPYDNGTRKEQFTFNMDAILRF